MKLFALITYAFSSLQFGLSLKFLNSTFEISYLPPHK